MAMTQLYDGDIGKLSGAPRAAALDDLVTALRSPDPAVRDDWAYVTAVRWIPALDSGERNNLGGRMAAYFTDPEPQARTFAPLILARIVEAGDWRETWWRPFADWYPAERDLRGYDPALGWLHAAAHGADLLAALSRCPGQDPLPLAGLAAERLLAPTDHLFDALEDDRIAYALARILSHPDLTVAQSVEWLEPITEALRAGEPGPVPAWASNAVRTLRMLYVAAHRGVRTRNTDEPPHPLTHRDQVLEALAETLAIVAPWTG